MGNLTKLDTLPPAYNRGLSQIIELPSTEKLPQSDTSSEASLSSPKDTEPEHTSTNPCSAFYTHPTTRLSLEQLKTSDLKTGAQIRIYSVHEADLEAGRKSSIAEPRLSKMEERVWPGREGISDKKYTCRRSEQMGMMKRTGAKWKALSARRRSVIKVVLLLLLIGAMVGLGVGIAKAVHGGVWSGQNNQVAVGDT